MFARADRAAGAAVLLLRLQTRRRASSGTRTDERREVRDGRSVSGDPDGEGIVWPRVAELSLLGALSCGGWLLQLVLDGLETEQSPYRCAVAATHTHATPCV